MFESLGKTRAQVQYKFWAHIGHDGQTLDQLVEKMKVIGNTVIERDEENQRLLVAKTVPKQDLWGCRLCLAEGQIVITDTETELLNHAKEVHKWNS